MLIQVNPHRIVLNKTNEVNSGEYNVNECTFEFSQEYEGLTKVAVFSLCDGTTKNVTILNNQCIIPAECLQETGQVQIGVYGYATQDNELVLRYSPTPQNFVVRLGSYKEGTEPVAPTPTDWEILVEQVSDIAEDVSSIHEDISGINGEISGINIDIRDLQDTKANISDLAEVAFTGEFSDLKNIPSYATTQQLNQEIQDRQDADVNLQSQIDAISVSSDVVDVVGTYQELVDYDTQHLKDNDIVKVLQDSTHSDALSYYRWDKETSTWSYVGSEGPFYTKSETDALLNDKQDVIDIDNMLSSDLVDDTNSTNKFVTQADINNWNNKEDKSNKVTEINSSSTDTQYPSAKCVYDSQEEQNEHLNELDMIYNAFPTVSAENETIQLDNTAKVKFREIDLKGNTSQVAIPEEQGTSVSNTSIYVSDVNTDKENTIEMSGNTYQYSTSGINVYNVNNGGNISPDMTIDSNYYVNCTYNNTSGTTWHYSNFMINKTDMLQTNTNYLIVAEIKSISGTGRFYPFTQHNNSCIQTANTFYEFSSLSAGQKLLLPVTTKSSFTADTKYDLRTLVSYEAGSSGSITFRLSILSDTTITADTFVYQPFTNGASPNPSYPQNIEVVTGTQNITIANGDNTQSTTYPINLGNIELCKINTYQDRIYKSNDKWYLEKNVGKVVLNGTENWQIELYTYYLTNFNAKPYSTFSPTTPYAYANYFKWGNGSSGSFSEGSFWYTLDGSKLRVQKDNLLDLNTFKTWLSTHNTIVYYPYATPTTTEITDTNLVNQLNALYNATIYPITNINTDTSNLLPYIDLHYNFVTPSPSPSRPSVVNVVKGNNTITISNSDNTESQSYPINLGDMELCKIGDYQDYIYESNGNWFKKGNVRHVSLNVSDMDNLEDYPGWSNQTQMKNDYPNKNGQLTTYTNYYSNIATESVGGISINTNNTGIIFLSKTIFNLTQSQWKTNYPNLIFELYYGLQTPTDTQITDATLITQLNNIKKAYSYDAQTNISQTNTDKPFIIYAEAIRSLKDVFE